MQAQIKAHKEETIRPLEQEIQAIEEEATMRATLSGELTRMGS
jgi:hypothetical protein